MRTPTKFSSASAYRPAAVTWHVDTETSQVPVASALCDMDKLQPETLRSNTLFTHI